jgi:hypothetical protein
MNTAAAENLHVYNSSYKGSTYSVKYLGIVDGTMGILSRKMAMQGTGPQTYNNISPEGLYTSSHVDMSSPKHQSKINLTKPVLGSKSYAQRQKAGVSTGIANNKNELELNPHASLLLDHQQDPKSMKIASQGSYRHS